MSTNTSLAKLLAAAEPEPLNRSQQRAQRPELESRPAPLPLLPPVQTDPDHCRHGKEWAQICNACDDEKVDFAERWLDRPNANPVSPSSLPLLPSVQSLRPLVIETEYFPGGTGPDYVMLVLRDGRVLQISDEGICVWRNLTHYDAGWNNPEHALTFGS